MQNQIRWSYAVRVGAVVLLLLLTYSLTRPPYLSLVRGTDGGELTLASATFGVAHPPGYGLYTLVSGLVLHFLPGNASVQNMQLVAHLTAIALSLLVGILAARWVRDPERKRQAFTCAALLCGWSRPVWEQATMIEVYLFGALLLGGLLWVILSHATPTPGDSVAGLGTPSPYNSQRRHVLKVFLLGHLLGLAITHHLTIVLWLPSLLILGWQALKPLSLRAMAWIVVGSITGLWPWLYLIVRAGHVPQANWGGIDQGVEAFIAHITAQDYRVFLQPVSLSAIASGIVQWITALPASITPFGAILFVIGAALMIRRREQRIWLLVLTVCMVCVAGFTGLYRAPDTQIAYTLPLIIPVVMITAYGLMRLIGFLPFMAREVFVWGVPLLLFVSFAVSADQKNDHTGVNFLAQVDRLAPPHAIVLVEKDGETFLLWQAQALEGWRLDVTIVNSVLLHKAWYAASLASLAPDLPLMGETQAQRLQSLYTTDRPIIAPRLIRPPSGMRALPLGEGWYCLTRGTACS